MASNKEKVVSPHIAALRAIEYIAQARSMLLIVGSAAQDQRGLDLYKKLAADLETASKETTVLLSWTKVSA